MFRANRIGTPWIHTDDRTVSTQATVPTQVANTGELFTGNVINSAPIGDFGRTAISWSGTSALVANQMFALGQQFNVSEPIEGNTVGIEVMSSIKIMAAASALIIPVLFECTAAGGAILAAVTRTGGAATYFNTPVAGLVGTHTVIPRAATYRDQFIYKGTSGAVAATFFHGFQIIDIGSAGYNLTNFQMIGAARQLTDQNDTGYRDTRR